MRRSILPGALALVLHLAAVFVFALLLDGYSHREFPLALLGAEGVPRALAFNLCAFVLPGMLAMVAMWRLRSALPADARWPARIGVQLMTLSGLAFAAQGLLPLDPSDVGAASNAMHALAWTLWWIAGTSGAALLVRAAPVRHLRVLAAVVAVAIPLLVLLPWPGALAAFAPRAAFVAWLLWVAFAPRFSRA
ncbi:MAG: DUF998 domain-containing protein [Lysobacter sp.]|nr:DUF998 domain-containing protein [Lysobacter sp.]